MAWRYGGSSGYTHAAATQCGIPPNKRVQNAAEASPIDRPFVEQLPVEIIDKRKGETYFLRIKARYHGKKWCIRYIRKVRKTDVPVADWKYRTELQAWGMTVEGAARKMVNVMKYHGYEDQLQPLKDNNLHL